ncbi:hypothetical protein TDB9533_00773 [Thalassocella blandensis]|nr:hypothetical protein TDB9533_00773 [Thalassocella blandensis]
MKWSIIIFGCFAWSALYSMGANAVNCPLGTSETLPDVCVENALGWKGATKLIDGYCDAEYTLVAGTDFCIFQNTMLSIENRTYVIYSRPGSSCPEGFGSYFDSSVCVNSKLALVVEEGTAKLDRPSPSIPNDQWLECPQGMMKSAGEFFCMALEIVLNTGINDYGVKPALSRCPKYWSSVQNGGFCWPSTGVVPCDEPLAIAGLKIIEQPWEACSVDIGNGLRAISSETAVQPLMFPVDGGFKLRPTVMCAPPGKGVSQMCEGKRIVFTAN